MADSYVLVGPDSGTQVDLASYTRAEGIDFGAAGLLKAKLIETPYAEGGLAFEQSGPRQMVFPLILRGSQSIPNLGLYDQEALLRRLARPGAALDPKPPGATTAVRFDVLTGRYELGDYSPHQARESLRLGKLVLDRSEEHTS